MFSPDLWNKSAVSGYDIDNSLRWSGDVDTPNLYRSPSSSGNRKIFTISVWAKRAEIGADQVIIGAAESSGSNNNEKFGWNSSDYLEYGLEISGSNVCTLRTSQVFRDPGAWYHLVLKYDSTPSTPGSSDVALYVNGVQVTALSTASYPSQDTVSGFNNSGWDNYIGKSPNSTTDYLDGYLAELYFIDGTKYAASDFGELSSTTNQWIPIDASGLTFGTNGFYQKYGSPTGHTSFTSVGSTTWTAPEGVTSVDYLVVGGGGGGGYGGRSGGGGAGGMRTGSLTVVGGTSYTVTVGAGGAVGTFIGGDFGNPGTNGGDSVFASITSDGGGGGGARSNSGASYINGKDGGSGGGGGVDGGAGTTSSGGSATSGQGYDGGTGQHVGGSHAGGGGGGGKSAVGGNNSGSTGGVGGAGLASSITGSSVTYAGGGGGGGGGGSPGGGGGTGGGGNSGSDGTDGLGGGGGSLNEASAGDGGNGIVIVRPVAGQGFGLDSSGEGNNFTSTNLVATDQMLDSPTNNFATMNSLDLSWSYPTGQPVGPPTLSEGNLKVSHKDGSNGYEQGRGTIAVQSGKWYFEALLTATTGTYQAFGIATTSTDSIRYWGGNLVTQWTYQNDGSTFNDDTQSSSDADTYTTGDIVSIAFDCDAGKIWFAKNNTWQGSGSPNPATGTDARYTNLATVIASDGNPVAPFALIYNTSSDWAINFGSDSSFFATKTAQGNQDSNNVGDFYYEPPANYLALCSDNLPSPEIALPGENFGTVAYSGNEANPTSAGAERTLDVGFQPDFSWLKKRNEVASNRLFDSTRGSNKALYSNANAAEAAGTAGYIDRWASTGPVVKAESDGDNRDVNVTGGTYVIWNWKAGGVPTATNVATTGVMTSGSVFQDGVSNTSFTPGSDIYPYKISANTTTGFSIINYEGNGDPGDGGQTIAHGLGSAVEAVFIKRYDSTADWMTGATPPGWTEYNALNYDSAWAASATAFRDTSPTASFITLGNSGGLNTSGADYVCYAFHSVEGYSKIGSYVGNDDADGPFVYTGFKPAFILIKYIDSSGAWRMTDNVRDPYNFVYHRIYADSNAAEYTSDTAHMTDHVSNGFKIRDTNTVFNADGGNYMYMAFSESPFKTSNAR